MLHVGFGDAVITPPTPVQLAGFIEDQPATEVHDDLEVRAMYLRGEHGAVCLLVCDLLGMSPSFARPVRESAAAPQKCKPAWLRLPMVFVRFLARAW